MRTSRFSSKNSKPTRRNIREDNQTTDVPDGFPGTVEDWQTFQSVSGAGAEASERQASIKEAAEITSRHLDSAKKLHECMSAGKKEEARRHLEECYSHLEEIARHV